MDYRGPGFLAVVWFGFSSNPPPPPPPVSKLSLYLSLPLCRRSSLLTGGGGRGAKSYDDGEKAWPSINHSILSMRGFFTTWSGNFYCRPHLFEPKRIFWFCKNIHALLPSKTVTNKIRHLRKTLDKHEVQNKHVHTGSKFLHCTERKINSFTQSSVFVLCLSSQRSCGVKWKKDLADFWYRQEFCGFYRLLSTVFFHKADATLDTTHGAQGILCLQLTILIIP